MRAILAILLLGLCALAHAHKPSDSYLTLQTEAGRVQGQWDIALRDLEFAVGLDANGDGEITWGELKARHGEVASYALARLQVAVGSAGCALRATDHLVDQHSDGAYAVIRFEAACPELAGKIAVGYSLFFDLDPTHRGLARIETGGVTQTAVFSPERRLQQFDLTAPSVARQIVAYAREGVWHIWIGYDHVLFLLSLLLPAVWTREANAWRAAPRFAPAFWEVFKVVTAFTIAHSITLSVAALGIVTLPSRLVESAIAASVLLAALNNPFPLVSARRWAIAFCFGLVHGFGFASVLTDLGLPRGALVSSLFGFNLGVEIGQLAIVSAFLPLAYALRNTWFYARVVFTGGSALVALFAAIWLAERALNVRILTG
ncbi:MAG: HupE/UreJ family protein [Betaproteobacteria bacterium]|nr:HupE/UreJ family protein [Betaproteobacteria bacterium]